MRQVGVLARVKEERERNARARFWGQVENPAKREVNAQKIVA
jgi:hypothetical protein